MILLRKKIVTFLFCKSIINFLLVNARKKKKYLAEIDLENRSHSERTTPSKLSQEASNVCLFIFVFKSIT